MKGGFSLLWVIMILISANEAICQTSIGDFNFSDNGLIIEGIEAASRGEFENAINFYTQSLEKSSSFKDSLAYIYTLDQLGYCYRRLGNFETAKEYLIQSEKEGIHLLGQEHPLLGEIYYHWAYFHYLNKPRKQDSALYFMQKSIKIKEIALPENHSDIARSYHGMGSMYKFMLNNYNEAIKYYLKAVKIKEVSDPESTSLANTYLFLGQTLYELNDPYSALPYLKTSRQIYNDHPEYDPAYIESVTNSLGNVYYYLKDYSQATQYYRESINFSLKNSNDSTNILTPLMNLGMALIDAGIIDRAHSALSKSLEINTPNGFITDSVSQSFIYSNLGIMYASQNNEDSALHYFNSSIKVNNYPEGDKTLISNSYNSIGDLYLYKNMHAESLRNFQSAIETLEGKFGSEGNTFANPNPNLIIYPVNIYNPLAGKARTYFAQYLTTGNVTFLTKAIEQYEYLSLLSNRIKTSNQLSDERKLEFAKLASNSASDALECLVEARKTNIYQKKEIEQAVFKIMEENRYVQLLSNLVGLKNNKNLDVPDSLLQKEKLLTEQIKNFEIDLNITLDSLDRLRIEKQQFLIIRELEKLHDYIQLNFPQYYQKNTPFSTLPKVLEVLSPKQQVIEYFWSDSLIYALAFNPDTIKFKVIEVSNDLITNLNSLRKFQTNELSREVQYNSYKNVARYIYNRLLLPMVFENTTQLIVSPSGPLNLIPFEALITDDSGNNFRDASYVLKKWDIQYVYSGSLLLEQKERKLTSSPLLLAMSYSDMDTLNIIADRNEAADIPASAIEVKMISEIFDSGTNKYFTGENASKQKFKELASNYQIIHLAVHGFSDTAKAVNSHLQFRADPDENEDGRLYAHELYGLNLDNLELAVLSACETGLGKQYRGEGVFSMARGFAYAGCPSTVMSLWKTDDTHTAELMQYFYTYLNQGSNVSHALRQAKLDYIQNNDSRFSNPYYWAGFVSLGSDYPVVKKTNNIMLFSIIGFLALIIVFIVIRRKKQDAV